jgi:hypothetical protein
VRAIDTTIRAIPTVRLNSVIAAATLLLPVLGRATIAPVVVAAPSTDPYIEKNSFLHVIKAQIDKNVNTY